jgi:hypothetical protein
MPGVRHTSRAVHSRYRRHPTDLPAFGHEIRISLLVRRFYCHDAHCPKRTFAEPMSLLLMPRARRTRRLAKALGRIGIMLGGRAGAKLAHSLAMPAGADTLLRLVRRLPLSRDERPSVVGVDDWAIAPTARSWSTSSGGASSSCCPTVPPGSWQHGCAGSRRSP